MPCSGRTLPSGYGLLRALCRPVSGGCLGAGKLRSEPPAAERPVLRAAARQFPDFSPELRPCAVPLPDLFFHSRILHHFFRKINSFIMAKPRILPFGRQRGIPRSRRTGGRFGQETVGVKLAAFFPPIRQRSFRRGGGLFAEASAGVGEGYGLFHRKSTIYYAISQFLYKILQKYLKNDKHKNSKCVN